MPLGDDQVKRGKGLIILGMPRVWGRVHLLAPCLGTLQSGNLVCIRHSEWFLIFRYFLTMAEPTQNSILPLTRFTWCKTWEGVLFMDGFCMAEQMARMPDFTWERVLFMDGYCMTEQMAWTPDLYIRKSPFMDEYRVNGSKAETFTQEWVLLRTDITWQSEWLEGWNFYTRKSPFVDRYYMVKQMAWRPHFYARMNPLMDG